MESFPVFHFSYAWHILIRCLSNRRSPGFTPHTPRRFMQVFLYTVNFVALVFQSFLSNRCSLGLTFQFYCFYIPLLAIIPHPVSKQRGSVLYKPILKRRVHFVRLGASFVPIHGESCTASPTTCGRFWQGRTERAKREHRAKRRVYIALYV